MTDTLDKFAAQRLRHPLKARFLQVRKIAHITPRMVRVTLHGPDLADFVSAAFDDHIKLFFPADGIPIMPEQQVDGLAFPDGVNRPPARDYTPRRYRAADNELDIDFLLHGDGPASNWVAQARVGDKLVSAGPRGSFIIPDVFDWQLMIGDETALPAIARRLEELPEGCRIHIIVLVQDAGEQQAFKARAGSRVIWLHRTQDGDDALLSAIRAFDVPEGEGYIWGGGEGTQMRAIHQYLVEEKGIDKSRIRISNYWKRGDTAD